MYTRQSSAKADDCGYTGTLYFTALCGPPPMRRLFFTAKAEKKCESITKHTSPCRLKWAAREVCRTLSRIKLRFILLNVGGGVSQPSC